MLFPLRADYIHRGSSSCDAKRCERAGSGRFALCTVRPYRSDLRELSKQEIIHAIDQDVKRCKVCTQAQAVLHPDRFVVMTRSSRGERRVIRLTGERNSGKQSGSSIRQRPMGHRKGTHCVPPKGPSVGVTEIGHGQVRDTKMQEWRF